MFEVHISKHSLFRLKITVGCLTSKYPSIHKKLSRSRSVVRGVCFLCVFFVCGVCCVLCGVLCWCWRLVVVLCGCCVLWVWCGVGCMYVCVFCVVFLLFISILFFLFLTLSLSPSLYSFLLLSSFLSSLFSSSLFFSLPRFLSLSFFPSTHQTLWKESINQHGGQLRRTAGAQQSVLSPPPFSPSLLPSPPPQKKVGTFLLQEYFRRGNYFLLQF